MISYDISLSLTEEWRRFNTHRCTVKYCSAMKKHEIMASAGTQMDLERIIPSEVSVQFSAVQLLSGVWLFAIPWTAALQAPLSITNSWSSPKLMSIESVMPSSHLILCCPRLLLPSIFPSIRVFSNEPALRMRWPMYWSFSFSISPSNEHPGLIFFRMDWLDLLAVQGTLKSLLQHHSSKASIFWCSAFFSVKLCYFLITGFLVSYLVSLGLEVLYVATQHY